MPSHLYEQPVGDTHHGGSPRPVQSPQQLCAAPPTQLQQPLSHLQHIQDKFKIGKKKNRVDTNIATGVIYGVASPYSLSSFI